MRTIRKGLKIHKASNGKPFLRAFTLLEIMLAILMLSIAGGMTYVKMHEAVQKKQFQSSLQSLGSRLAILQKIAVATQADWQGTLKKEGQEWVFKTDCEEANPKRLTPLKLSLGELFFNGKKVELLTFDFFATGQVTPSGELRFVRKKLENRLLTANLFQRQEGKREM
jgi:prepilin-type N-terminal cleavage/methylation domain-containing protein